MPSLDITGQADKTLIAGAMFDSMDDDENEDDILYEEAKQVVIESPQSLNFLSSEKLGIGYARTSTINRHF